MITIIRPVALRRLFPQNVRSLQIRRDTLVLDTNDGPVEVKLETTHLEHSSSWFLLKRLTLVTQSGTFHLDGTDAEAIDTVKRAIVEGQRRSMVLDSWRSQSPAIAHLVASWDDFATNDAYLTFHDVENWSRATGEVLSPADGDADLIDQLSPSEAQALRKLTAIRADPTSAARQLNTVYAREQLRAFQPFFDSVETQPLTNDQRLAVVYDEENSLVIAGAGTGKTSTAVAKVGFILQKGWAKPEEILLLAFTKKAAEEMQERLRRRLGIGFQVRTFHALGLEIVATARGRKPSLCAEAEDEAVKAATIKSLIAGRMMEDAFRRDYLAFQSTLKQPYKPVWEFASQTEYTQYLLDVEPRCLTGRLLRSYEECEIANWLITHGIQFEYERPYVVDTASQERRQYKPDFFLPDYGIYIEHWGVDHHDRTAPFVNQSEYLEKMRWARETHQTHGTKLVETFSWERRDGVLLTRLEEKLRGHRVEPQPITAKAVLALDTEAHRADPFVRLNGTFLSHFKSGGFNVTALQEKMRQGSNPPRNTLFLRLFAALFTDYETLIHGRGEIDFDDMIGMARGHVEDGTYRSPFRYLLVDEFQDISLGRGRLLRSLRNQKAGTKLFCVGDDWQSIYRFSGSNISLTTQFEKFFGFTAKTTLKHTFRFHNKIAQFSSRFVQKNPSQLRKELTTNMTSPLPGVVVVLRDDKSDPLEDTLGKIAAASPSASVLLLGRYRHTLPHASSLTILRTTFPSLKIQAMTAHASKGLEADFVIVLDMNQGKYGFPSEIADDPVLAMVLPESEQFPFAEERRLFYVALTRARNRVYLVSEPGSLSGFVREILCDTSYEKAIIGETHAAGNVCPLCHRGRVIERAGDYGRFYSCSNFPICSFKPAECPRCWKGWMRDDEVNQTRCGSCDFLARHCPNCKTGILRERRGKFGPFWGCSNYGRSVGSCNFTEKIR